MGELNWEMPEQAEAVDVGDRVQAIIDAAQDAAAALGRQAEQRATAIVAAAKTRADEISREHDARLAAQGEALLAQARELIAQASEASASARQLEDRLNALGDALVGLSEDVTALRDTARAGRSEPAPAAAPPAPAPKPRKPAAAAPAPPKPVATEPAPEAEDAEPATSEHAAGNGPVSNGPATSATESVPDPFERPLSRRARARAAAGRRGSRPAPPELEAAMASGVPAPGLDQGDPDGARLVALHMAIAGDTRGQVDDYLRQTFALGDRREILDDVFGRGTAADATLRDAGRPRG